MDNHTDSNETTDWAGVNNAGGESGQENATAGNAGGENSSSESHGVLTSTVWGQKFSGIPLSVMKELRAIALEVNQEEKVLKVAAADPDNPGLTESLSRYVPGLRIEIRPVEPEAIDRVLERISQMDSESPSGLSDSQKIRLHSAETPVQNVTSPQAPTAQESDSADSNPTGDDEPRSGKRILIVTPDSAVSSHVIFALQAEGVAIKVTGSVSEALDLMTETQFDTVFVHRGLPSGGNVIEHRVREASSSTHLKYFDSDLSLVVNDTEDALTTDILSKSLRFVRHVCGWDGESLRSSHAVMVEMITTLAERLKLPPSTRTPLLCAAYLLDVARIDLVNAEEYKREDIIGLSAGRLETWQFPGTVVRLLRLASGTGADEQHGSSDRECLAASVLAAADSYGRLLPAEGPYTSAQLDDIKQQLQGLRGTLSHPEVVDHLLELAAEKFSACDPQEETFRVLVLDPQGNLPEPGRDRLTQLGMTIAWSDSVEDCARAWADSKPQSLVICNSGSAEDQYELLLSLALNGVRPDQVPTLLLVEDGVVWEAMKCLKYGVEDILPVSVSPDALQMKLKRIHDRCKERSRLRLSVLSDLGTHGSLNDMSLPDLLSGLRGNSRPAHVAVSAQGQQLTVFVDKNTVLFAECGETVGVEALAKGVTWKDGIWSIDPIEPDRLPEPNVNKPIDTALLEACIEYDHVERG
jgi:DNA-binding response OmpR family regulator